MKKILPHLIVFLFGMTTTAVILLISAAPRGDSIVLQPPPTPSPLVVQVSGAVMQPGLYALPHESRVADAIQAAGGFTAEANGNAVNQAARIRDGERITIPKIGEAVSSPQTGSELSSGSAGQPEVGQPADDPFTTVNINTATRDELLSLPGVGPTKADAIIMYREEHGGFKNIEEIQEVPGIGPSTFEKLKSLITID